jgi:hypothetical protein
MTTGVLIAPDRGAANLIDDALDKARAAHDSGVRQLWLGQQLDYDAIGLAAVIGTAIPDVAVGRSVVALLPLQAGPADLRRVYGVAADF